MVGTTNFPASLDSHANGSPAGFAVAVDDLQTSLSADLSATATTINVTSNVGFPTAGIIVVGTGDPTDPGEPIPYTGKSGTTQFTGGVRGSLAQIHLDGATVSSAPSAANHNDIAAAVVAIETYIQKTGGRTRLINGDARVQSYSSVPATDNSWVIDGCRMLLESASSWVFTRDTTSVPTVSSGYAFRLTGQATNNLKGGLFFPVVQANMADCNGDVVSAQAQILVSNARIGNVKMGIAQRTSGTVDTFADPVTTWGAEGTTPTLTDGWAFINTPANLGVTTSYVNYKVENQAVSGANALCVLIWCDDRTWTAADYLSVAEVKLEKGAICTPIDRPHIRQQLLDCNEWYEELGGDAMFQPFGTGEASAANNAACPVPHSLKRIKPAISVSAASDFDVSDGAGGVVACTSIALAFAGKTQTGLNCGTAGGLTAGRIARLVAANTNARLKLDANP